MSDAEGPNSVRVKGAEENFGRPWAYESTVSLRFCSETLIPEEITEVLGIQPHIAHRKGGSSQPSVGQPSPMGVWIYWMMQESEKARLEDKVLLLLEELPQNLEIWHQLTMNHSGILSCSLRFDEQGCGQYFSGATLEKIAQRRLSIDLDIKFDLA